ncbi:hypothetical protein D9M73_65850 [compost metagenome]|nr:MAG TPA: terminase small subunit [Caudoviricetes sp.]
MPTKKKPPVKKKPVVRKPAPKAQAKPAAKATPTVKEKKPAHRPSAYKPEYAEQAYKLCLLGATDKKLGDFFNVSEQTVNAWKLAHADFLESITRGKEGADAEIAQALFHRAKGYSHPEDDIKSVALGGNMGSEIVITPTIKHYPPDTQAASLWLRNRQPKLWRDKTEVTHANDKDNPLIPAQPLHSLTTEQLLAIASGKKE